MPPARLYKYASLAPPGLDRVIATITTGTVYFASPIGFNDPFEFRFGFSMEGTNEQWLAFLNQPEVWKQNNVPEGIIPSIIDRMFWKRAALENESTIAAQFREGAAKDVGLFCLAEPNDDLLMWAHYANCHKGVCIGFDPSKDSLFSDETEQVIYQDEFPVVHYFTRDIPGWTRLAVATKSKHWAYEREWRVMRAPEGQGLYTVTDGTVAEVILGSEISTEDEVAITLAARSKGIALFRAVRLPASYGLTIVPIP